MTSLTVSGQRAVDKETGEVTEESVVAEVGPELEIAPPNIDVVVKHAWIMWISWSIFGFVQIGSNRWFFTYWKQAQIIHTLSGWAIVIATLVAGF